MGGEGGRTLRPMTPRQAIEGIAVVMVGLLLLVM
jgi:hypothetical protein